MKNLSFDKEFVSTKIFRQASIEKFGATASQFSNCRFESIKIKECCFGLGSSASIYEDCFFNNTTFSSSAPGCAVFVRCIFENIDFKKLFFTDVVFIDCSFSGNYKKGSLVGEHPSPIDAKELTYLKSTGNNFSGLEFGDVSFHNLDFTEQIFSDAQQTKIITDVDRFLVFVKAQLNQVGDFKLFDDVNRVIEIMQMKNEDTNNQAWFEPLNFPNSLQQAAIYIAELIKKV